MDGQSTGRHGGCRCSRRPSRRAYAVKSDLQRRAEAARARFSGARKPIVLELAGVPKAGKTTTLNQIRAFLKRCGFRVEIVVERAAVCPIRDKKHPNFNVWTACATLSQVLEKTQAQPRPDDPDILILDRGLFDAVCWFAFMERVGRILPNERARIEQFLVIEEWRRRITGVIVMTADPRVLMEREKGDLPVESSGGLNEAVLRQMLETTQETVQRLAEQFRIFEIDTSNGSRGRQQTAERVAGIVLDLIEEQLDEHILRLPVEDAAAVFRDATCIEVEAARRLVAAFASKGQFISRAEVESDTSVVQALPVVIVRNRSGNILRLIRRERRRDHSLHEKVVIWAGGHVRKEDNCDGNAIRQCAVRELQEELRLSVEETELDLLGAVWIRTRNGTSASDKTRQHVAVVFEWRARADDVAIALSATEFFDRRGTSLSGTFVTVDDLAADIDKGQVSEPWSVEIARRLLTEVADLQAHPRLL